MNQIGTREKKFLMRNFYTISSTCLFEEYSEKLKGCIKMRRENGILEAKMHTHGGPVQWSAELPSGPSLFL